LKRESKLTEWSSYEEESAPKIQGPQKSQANLKASEKHLKKK